jgi:hypothetical protein
LPQLHLFRSRQTALNTLQGYNSNSSSRTSLQRVFVRPKHLYTRRPLSPPRTVPSLHVRSVHVSQRTTPSVPKQPGVSRGRVVPLGTSCPCRFQPRPEAFPTRGTPGPFETFDTEARPPAPSAPMVGTAQMGCSCTTKTHMIPKALAFPSVSIPKTPRCDRSCA